MFMQSAAMALGFGSFFQYGKRKLSAMSNEEFNALTPEALTAQLLSSINNMIPLTADSFKQMERLNVDILNAMATYFTQGIEYLGGFLSGKNVPTTIGGSTFSPQNIPGGLQEVLGLDFLSNLTPEQISGLPGASGTPELSNETVTTTNLNPIEKFASKWMNPNSGIANYRGMKLAEAKYILQQMNAGNLKRFSQFRAGLVRYFDKIGKAPTAQEQQQITQTKIGQTSSGLIKAIAIAFNNITYLLRVQKYLKVKSTGIQKIGIAIDIYNKLVKDKKGMILNKFHTINNLKITLRYPFANT